jgi:hypothetical protein
VGKGHRQKEWPGKLFEMEIVGFVLTESQYSLCRSSGHARPSDAKLKSSPRRSGYVALSSAEDEIRDQLEHRGITVLSELGAPVLHLEQGVDPGPIDVFSVDDTSEHLS